MSSSTLPDFEKTVRLSQGLLDSAELAECHGLLCGLLCNGLAGSVDDYLDQLAAMRLLTTPEPALASLMADAWAATRSQMDDDDLGFTLWLPDDDEPLEERTISLGQWCSGFLAGLGSQMRETLSGEAREALEDLIEISRVEVAEGQRGPDGSEEEETAFAEIVEYVRIVVLTLREEFRGPESGDAIH